MTTTKCFPSVGSALRARTETNTDAWKRGTGTPTDQMEFRTRFIADDLTAPCAQYPEFSQHAIEPNSTFATKWAELATSPAVTDHAASHIGLVTTGPGRSLTSRLDRSRPG